MTYKHVFKKTSKYAFKQLLRSACKPVINLNANLLFTKALTLL